MTVTWLFILLITLLLSAFFSGMEIAFVSVNKLEMDMALKDETWVNTPFFEKLNEKPRLFLSATLLGNNISLVLFGIAFAKLFDPLLIPLLPIQGNEMWLLVSNTLISTVVILFAGEYIPKSIFRLNPMRLLRYFATPFKFVYILLFPIISLTVYISEIFFKLITGTKPEPEMSLLSHFDLRSYIDERLKLATIENEEGDTVNIDADMLGKVVDFESAKARECLVPRNEIEGISFDASFQEIKQKIIDSGHSRLIAYEENIDNPRGYFFHQDILRNEKTLHPIDFYPGSKSAWEILSHFIQNKKSLAIIVDEYGGTAGMVTLEDLIEEIFGEINDEYDKLDEDQLIEVIEEGKKYRFSARIEIDYIRDEYDLRLPQGDEYETIGGLIAHTLEYIPEQGESVSIGQYTLVVEKALPSRIEQVLLTVN